MRSLDGVCGTRWRNIIVLASRVLAISSRLRALRRRGAAGANNRSGRCAQHNQASSYRRCRSFALRRHLPRDIGGAISRVFSAYCASLRAHRAAVTDLPLVCAAHQHRAPLNTVSTRYFWRTRGDDAVSRGNVLAWRRVTRRAARSRTRTRAQNKHLIVCARVTPRVLSN